MLATETATWTPWYVLPKFATADRGDRGATWVVEAEEPPPLPESSELVQDASLLSGSLT